MKRLIILFFFLLGVSSLNGQSYGGVSFHTFLPTGELKQDSPQIWGAGFNIQGAYNINQSPVYIGGYLDFTRYGSEVRDGWHGQVLGDIRHRRHNEITRLLTFVRLAPDCNTGFYPYADFMAGVNYVYTRSILRDSALRSSFDNYTDLDDFSFTYGIGAGIEIPLDELILLDINFKSLKSSRTEYLTPSNVNYDSQSQSYLVDISQSRFDSFTFGIGLKFYID